MEWMTVRIPKPLADDVDSVVSQNGRWASRAEFVKDAVRRYLEQISTHGEVAPDA